MTVKGTVVTKKKHVRILFYLLGLSLLAVGLTLNTKATLGVSPLISVAYSAALIWGWSLGDTVFIWYGVFVLTEMVMHWQMGKEKRKQRLLNDLLQLPLSLVFSRMMDFCGQWIPEFETAFPGTFLADVSCRILILVAAVFITGQGAALTLNMRFIPNPGDGVVQSLSDRYHWKMGTAKNLFDLCCVILTVLISYMAAGRVLGIGIGTLIAMLGTGRSIALFNRIIYPQLKPLVY